MGFTGITRAVAVLAFGTVPVALAAPGDWEGEGELGILLTSGNSDETNINGQVALTHEVEQWRNTVNLRNTYSESDEETTAESYRSALETNYKFSEDQYWFLRGAYEKDRFSGYDFQSSATTGYGNRVWSAGERSFLDLSAGLGYRFNRLEEVSEEGDREESEAIARFAGQFDYELSETALFRQKLGTDIGLEDNNVITESATSVQAKLHGNLSMKATYRVEHVSDAPEGSASTDTETSLALLYGF